MWFKLLNKPDIDFPNQPTKIPTDSSNIVTPKEQKNEKTIIYNQESTHVKETFYFDPNTADSTTLLRLGLSPWMVKNIYKYRSRGGVYNNPTDFAKTYGLTKGDWDRLKPYIRIADEFKLLKEVETQLFSNDSASKNQKKHKLQEGSQIPLNTSDTTLLQKIPGIGPYYARTIINYRERLGGFYSTNQLNEIEDLPQNIEKWFVLDTINLKPIYVNRLRIKELRRHPYLNFYQSKVIEDHRRKYGPLKSLNELSQYDEFTQTDLERLKPYLCFE